MNRILNWLIAISLVLVAGAGALIFALNSHDLIGAFMLLIVVRLLGAFFVVLVTVRVSFFLIDTYADLSPEERTLVNKGGMFLFRLLLTRMKRHPKYGEMARDVEDALRNHV